MMIPSDDQQELDLSRQALASKKMRMTLACVRCRSKKVKCDTAHPSCERCSQAKAPCSYEGTSTQVDLFNIVKLNDIVDTLQQRVQTLESTIGDIQQTTNDNLNGKDPAAMATDHDIISVPRSTLTSNDKHHHTHQWTLSLTPTGLRIDTNIASPPNLYDILLSGISQLDLGQDNTLAAHKSNGDPAACLTCTSRASLPEGNGDLHNQQQQQPQQQQQQQHTEMDKTAMVTRKTPLWRSNFTSFPLYNTWTPSCSPKEHNHMSSLERPHIRHYQHHHNGTMPQTTYMFILDDMIDIYNECFLCLPDTDYEGTIGERYHQGRLDPLLANAIFAWSARHGTIYHNLFPGQDPNDVGECYFDAAKALLKDRFMIPTMDTLHSLLVMYLYAIGRPSKPANEEKDHQSQSSVESEAYIFLGLAIRMCLDLKLHKENTNEEGQQEQDDNHRVMQMERYRRFFWVLYFLETLCALHSDRPFSLPSEDQITVAYPDLLDNETGERRWRAEYMIKRIRITRIYRNIIQRTSQDQLLFSSISELDSSLCQWYDQLPHHLKYEQGDHLRRNWQSTSFREQACVKLNFEYHFQRCQLYAMFMKCQQNDESLVDDDNIEGKNASSIMERKAKEICLTSATMTAELMTCWKQLRQRWCHFSLESMMMAVNIFEILMKDKDHVEQAKTDLTIMLDILLGSPIQHHRYVKLVIDRIQRLVYTTSNNFRGDEAMKIDTTMTYSETDDSKSQDQQNGYRHIYPSHQSRYEQQQHHHHHHHHHHHQETRRYYQPIDHYNGAYRMQKSDGMIGTSLSDLPFSDFLYNPVMEIPSPFGPYTTAANTTIQASYPPTTHPTLSAPSSSYSLASMLPPNGKITETTTSVSPSSASSSPSSLSISPQPRKLPTTLAPTAYQQDLQPENDYSAASLWITLHQPTYAASNQLDSFDYTALQQSHRPDQPHNGPPYSRT